MNKKFIFLLLFISACFIAKGQDQYAKNGAYLELFGNGGLYSINYERFLSPNFSLRAGFGSYSVETWWDEIFSDEKTSIIAFPVLANYFYGRERHKLELGAGVLLGSKKFESGWGAEMDTSSAIFDLTAVVGYRYQNPNGGIILRAGVTPFYAISGGEDAYPDKGFSLSGGVSVGYAF